MAIWQYTFHVLPKEVDESPASISNFKRGEDGFDDEPYWQLNHNNRNFFKAIETILPKHKSWSKDIDLYGDQESNCFEVLCDDTDNILSASFRIDFRSNYEKILIKIIEFCNFNKLCIIDEELKIVNGDFDEVRNIIDYSHQVKRYHYLQQKNRPE